MFKAQHLGYWFCLRLQVEPTHLVPETETSFIFLAQMSRFNLKSATEYSIRKAVL
jgi:hypothetical protein